MRTDPVENNVIDYIKRLSKKVRRMNHAETRVNELSDIADKGGTWSDIELRSYSDPSAPKEVGDGFTGTFFSGQGIEFDSVLYGVGTVIDDVLQAGMSMDGQLLAGAGAIKLDADGIQITAGAAAADLNSYKIVNSSGTMIGRFTGSNEPSNDLIQNYLESQGNAAETQASLWLKAIHNDASLAQIKMTTTSGNAKIEQTADDIDITATDDINIIATDDTTIKGQPLLLSDSGDNTSIILEDISISIDAKAHSLLINAASLDSTDGNIYPGTYTPTLTNVTNIAASTPNAYTMYLRVIDYVWVWGTVSIDPTAAGAIDMGISLPIASTLNLTSLLGGTACDLYSDACRIFADTTNNRARLQGVMTNVTNRAFGFSFGYRII